MDWGKDMVCEDRKLINTEIIEDVTDGKYNASGVLLGGRWVEIWTIKRCGKEFFWRVVFTADGRGGTNFKISE
jgi:hypothetical protein